MNRMHLLLAATLTLIGACDADPGDPSVSAGSAPLVYRSEHPIFHAWEIWTNNNGVSNGLPPGGARDIAATPQGAIAIARGSGFGDGEVFQLNTYNRQWTSMHMWANRVATTPDGDPWVVTSAGYIYEFVNLHNGTGGSWTQRPGGARDIAIDEANNVWVLSNDNIPDAANGRLNWWDRSAQTWQPVPGTRGTRLAAGFDYRYGRSTVYTVDSDHYIYVLEPYGTYWGPLPGRARDVGVGYDGSMYVVGLEYANDGNPSWWNNATYTWYPYIVQASNVAVDGSGYVWLTSSAGDVYHMR